ncbi:hypothetical protein SUGI_0448400 [Cryptomeria japonica]|uniref:galactinol synthase 2-like n=1 Tax=Cryptomeria japonica TaxID=3369 RepID=UPI002408C688|nr:galactinol synthase 2-like [Cryptomeria japonica]GLJ23680.1 hypothetical protein SUGI_0448400 [Cryptomeria japonica]
MAPADRRCGKSERAYVTFLAGGGDYVKGVIGLAKGLRRVRSLYPLVVAVLPDVPEDHRLQLRRQACILREIEPISPPHCGVEFAMAYYVLNYSKLRIWEFEDYSKMVYLDADTQVYHNIDDLFEREDGYLYGVMDCFCEKTWSHSPQYKIGYCQQCPEKVQWPLEFGEPPHLYFNAGMFVFEPSRLVFDSIMETLQVTTPTCFAEQDFLNMFFRDVYRPLSPEYNLVTAMLWRHPEKVDIHRTKVVHYCADGAKPWRFSGKEQNMDREDVRIFVERWWSIYNDSSLEVKGENGVEANSRKIRSWPLGGARQPKFSHATPAA